MALGINEAVTVQYGSVIITMPMGAFFFIVGTLRAKKLKVFL